MSLRRLSRADWTPGAAAKPNGGGATPGRPGTAPASPEPSTVAGSDAPLTGEAAPTTADAAAPGTPEHADLAAAVPISSVPGAVEDGGAVAGAAEPAPAATVSAGAAHSVAAGAAGDAEPAASGRPTPAAPASAGTPSAGANAAPAFGTPGTGPVPVNGGGPVRVNPPVNGIRPGLGPMPTPSVAPVSPAVVVAMPPTAAPASATAMPPVVVAPAVVPVSATAAPHIPTQSPGSTAAARTGGAAAAPAGGPPADTTPPAAGGSPAPGGPAASRPGAAPAGTSAGFPLADESGFATPGAGSPAVDAALGGRPGADVTAELAALRRRLDDSMATNIGFPATTGFDYSALAPFFAGYMLNNLGDPYTDGAYPIHTKPMEREVVDSVADLFGAPADDRWGYVTSGATEGTEYALHLARTLHPDAVVYHSAAAHHSVTNVIGRLGMVSVAIRADALGEIDYDDLADQVDRYRIRPAIVIANIGTAVTEAVDDVAKIRDVLDRAAVHRRWIHGDAALAGLPLALLDPDDRPAIDFPAGIDSVVTSGHKFLGAPVPCAVVVVRNSHRQAHARFVTYTGSPDTTVANSRSGLAALVLWYALRTHGLDGLRQRAEQSRQLAAAAHEALREIGWPAHRHRHALTVSFPTPPAAVTGKWVLATHGANSLIVCMPGVTAAQIDAFVADLRAAITPAGDVAPSPPGVEKRRGLLRAAALRL